MKVIVTHHVELVLPGAHYLIRMLDGRIDTQGTIGDLRAKGVLDAIAEVEDDTHRQYHTVESSMVRPDPNVETEVGDGDAAKSKKTPRKLVEEEHRETGRVKWKIYSTYLKAS